MTSKRDRVLRLTGLPGAMPSGQRVPVGGAGGGLRDRFEDADRSRARILKSQRKKRKKPNPKQRLEQRLQAFAPILAGRISEGNLVFTTPKVEADLKATKELVELKKEKLRILERERTENARLEREKLRIETQRIFAGHLRDEGERQLRQRELAEEARRFDEDVGERERARQAELRRIAEEQVTIREANAREDERRAQQIDSEREQAILELQIRGQEQADIRERQRQVDADRAESDFQREETFQQVVNLLRHNRAPQEFGSQRGNREPSAIDELIDAVEEVGERAQRRQQTPRSPQPEPAPSLADESRTPPRRVSRRAGTPPRPAQTPGRPSDARPSLNLQEGIPPSPVRDSRPAQSDRLDTPLSEPDSLESAEDSVRRLRERRRDRDPSQPSEPETALRRNLGLRQGEPTPRADRPRTRSGAVAPPAEEPAEVAPVRRGGGRSEPITTPSDPTEGDET
tara:strand:- start:250 stop:1626 length:1377 start_codon:yes stop_codon:yes gene_type:complete